MRCVVVARERVNRGAREVRLPRSDDFHCAPPRRPASASRAAYPRARDRAAAAARKGAQGRCRARAPRPGRCARGRVGGAEAWRLMMRAIYSIAFGLRYPGVGISVLGGVRSSCGAMWTCAFFSAFSRSRYFCTLPVEVLSIGPKATFFGILNPANSSRQ